VKVRRTASNRQDSSALIRVHSRLIFKAFANGLKPTGLLGPYSRPFAVPVRHSFVDHGSVRCAQRRRIHSWLIFKAFVNGLKPTGLLGPYSRPFAVPVRHSFVDHGSVRCAQRRRIHSWLISERSRVASSRRGS
jgi:hypothetical protein